MMDNGDKFVQDIENREQKAIMFPEQDNGEIKKIVMITHS